MLTSALRKLVKNPTKENFYGKTKKKKKTINGLTVFFIFHKNDVKTFFNILTSVLRILVSIFLIYKLIKRDIMHEVESVTLSHSTVSCFY